jgi:hypothetical protein
MKSLLCTLQTQKTGTLKIFFLSYVLVFLFYGANAQWSKYPSVNNPVCTETDEQLSPSITSDGAGGSIITWYDKRGGSEYDIYAQRLDALGNPQWTTGGVVVCSSSNDQMYPVICPDGNGGAFIAWTNVAKGGNSIYAQLIDASGNIQWGTDGIEICSAGAQRQNLRIVYESNNGGCIIVWEDYRSGGADIYAQGIGPKGKVYWNTDGNEVCTEIGEQRMPRITMDADNSNVIIAWDDTRRSKKGTVYDIYAQKMDLSGAVQWNTNGNEICIATGDQLLPDITSDDSGGAIITWHDLRGTSYDIFAQRMDATGSAMWTTDGIVVSSAAGTQANTRMIMDGSHGAIITWIDGRSSGATHIYAQRINGQGSQLWTSNGVAICTSGGTRNIPEMIPDYSGGAIIVWSDNRSTSYDIYAQKVNGNGLVQWGNNGVQVSTASNDQLDYTIVSDDFGGAFIAWDDARGSAKDIYSQNILSEGGLGVVPEITIRGKNQVILDNDNNPALADGSDFGSVTTLTTLTSKFTIYNSGNEKLRISNISTSGTSSTYFVPQSLTYPISIDPRDSMSFTVVYTSAGLVGVNNAVLNIDNNDSNEATYNFAIRATFKAPKMDVKGNNVTIVNGDNTPSDSDSTDFGKTRKNKLLSHTFTITNSGTDTLKISNITITGTNSPEFTISTIITYPRKLAAGKTMTLTVLFLPQALGSRTAKLNISSNDPSDPSFSFAIQGTSVLPVIEVRGNLVNIANGDVQPSTADFTDFGNVHTSSPKTRTFKIFNTGSDVLTISNIAVGGLNASDFTLQTLSYPQMINAGDSLEFEVNFTPIVLGLRIADINITSDDDVNASFKYSLVAIVISQEIDVRGKGISIATGDNTPVTGDNTSYGNLSRNGSKTNRFYVVNTGTDVLAVSGISMSGVNASLFSVGALTPASPIAAGDSSYFDVTFNPTSNGLKSATVTITNDDADEGAYNFAVQGLSLSAIISVKGNQVVIADGNTSISDANNTGFGTTEIPSTILKSYKIFNKGNEALVLTSINISGANASDFAVQGITFPKNVGPGDSVLYSIEFNPSDSGLRNAIVTINSNDLDIAAFDYAIQGRATKKNVGITENQLEHIISCYPNPANGQVNIVLPAGSASSGISIVSADGKSVIYQGTVTAGLNRIDISGFATGIYVISIEIDGMIINKKLAINR